MALVDHIELHYRDGARSLHTLLRITDPDTGVSNEVLFDNLYTVMRLVCEHDLRVVEETVGNVPLVAAGEQSTHDAFGGASTIEVMSAWREQSSGSLDETVLVLCEGDPELLAGV